MKTFTIIAAVALALATPVSAGSLFGGDTTNNYGGQGGKGGNANQSQGQGQAQGQSQTSNTSVNVETPSLSYGAFLGLSSTNNDECGRVILGLIPMTGENCNDIRETKKIANIVERLHSKDPAVRAGARAEMLTWASTDRTARRHFRNLGLIR